MSFEGHYRDARARSLSSSASADVVLLPYDSVDQVTSGVLVEAVAAGMPVVATGFPHAVELLDGGAGIVVAHRDPVAIAGALRGILDPELGGRADVRRRGCHRTAAVARGRRQLPRPVPAADLGRRRAHEHGRRPRRPPGPGLPPPRPA